MKTSAPVPSFKKVQLWLGDDPLRNLASKKKWLKTSPSDFTQDLIDRLSGARYEPRVAESIVERIVTFPEKLDLSLLLAKINNAEDTRLHALAPLVQFAENLCSHPQTLLLAKYLESFRTKKLKRINGLESFYIGATTQPGPRTLRVVREENLNIWAQWGFWAGSEPYSKELLKTFNQAKTSRLAPYALFNAIATYAKNCSPKWFSLSDIYSAINLGISKRQLSRILNSHPQIKRSGILKGARYFYK